jgi:hypothetical protein
MSRGEAKEPLDILEQFGQRNVSLDGHSRNSVDVFDDIHVDSIVTHRLGLGISRGSFKWTRGPKWMEEIEEMIAGLWRVYRRAGGKSCEGKE